jgi:hypothetical protein
VAAVDGRRLPDDVLLPRWRATPAILQEKADPWLDALAVRRAGAAANVTSCRPRHDVLYADRFVMPMLGSKRPAVRRQPSGAVGITIADGTRSQRLATTWP